MAESVTVSDADDLYDLFESRGCGDGLPVQPPTVERVRQFVDATGLSADTVLMNIPPRWAPATVEMVAINSVMAGCRPQYMPIIVSALAAMAADEFLLFSVQTTTHPVATLLLVNGPIADALDINGGSGAFGPGWRANATIGRALRLICLNIGGARPGVGDMATQGTPAKYTYCVSENERESPWEPFHLSRGFAESDSVVTVAGVEGPYNINDHASFTGEQILTTIVGTITHAGSNLLYVGGADPFLFLGPEHAQAIAADGYGREDVQQFIFERAFLPRDRIGLGQFEYLRKRHKISARYHELALDSPELAAIPLLTNARDLNVVVVGGAGKHSSFAATMTRSRSVSKLIQHQAEG